MRSSDKMVFKFGDNSLSDVVFLVGENEFHCHRMFLSVKSEFFKTMFSSGFREKTDTRIPMSADPMTFKRLMEIIYNGYTDDYKELFTYNAKTDFPVFLKKMWAETCALFEHADLYLTTDLVRKSVEFSLLASPHNCSSNACPHCGLKLLLAVRYGMEEYKRRDTRTNRLALISAMELTDRFVFPFDEMMYLMRHH